MIDSLLCNLGDMNHALLAGSKLDKRTELFDADNLSGKDLTLLKLCGDDLDHIDRLIHHCLICTAYGNRTVIRDIDLDACSGNDLIDRLASLSDHITDLLRIDLDLDDLRRILANLCSGCCDRRLHTVVHDEKSCLTASCNRSLHDRSCQTVDLDIHLNCCDTFRRTSHLEIHVPEEIFQSLNIGKQYKIIVCITCYQTAGNTSHHLLDRHAGSHQ